MTVANDIPRGLAQDLIAALGSSMAHQLGPVRVGIDVVSIEWFARMLDRSSGRAMTEGAFTAAERAYCDGRPDRYAARWAAKEAVAKAIGTGFRGLRAGDIEILHHPNGRPSLAPTLGSTWPGLADTWEWSLSLCHENDAALALAVAVVPADVVGSSTQPC